jgi:hypothetical protein
MDLEKFEQFRRKFDPSFANKGGSQSNNSSSNNPNAIKWPSNSAQSRNQVNDDDDLYS